MRKSLILMCLIAALATFVITVADLPTNSLPTSVLSTAGTTSGTTRKGVVPGFSWPSRAFVSGRGYSYDDYFDILVTDTNIFGSIDARRARHLGTALSPTQIAQFQQILSHHVERSWMMPCIDPHHAIILFDETESIVAHIQICFACATNIADPAIRHDIDYGMLAEYMDSLGHPVTGDSTGLQMFLTTLRE